MQWIQLESVRTGNEPIKNHINRGSCVCKRKVKISRPEINPENLTLARELHAGSRLSRRAQDYLG